MEKLMRLPGAARKEPIVGAPVKELAAYGADGIAGQMGAETGEEAKEQAAGAEESATLGEDI